MYPRKGSLSLLSTSVEYIIGSGASLTLQGLKTVTHSNTIFLMMTANGIVVTNEEATVCFKDLAILLCVKLVEDSPAVLSLGMLCETMGYLFPWTTGMRPSLTQNGITCERRSEKPCPSGRSYQTSVNSSGCRRRLCARLVTTVHRRLS